MTAPDSTGLLAHQLRELVGLYLFAQRTYAHDQGLSQTGRLLMLLQKHGPATQTDFARLAGLDKSWISRIVERLVEEGLIERHPHENDRRCHELRLSPSGEYEASRYDALLTAHAMSFFDGVPPASHADLSAALGTIITALRKPSLHGTKKA